MKKLIVAPYVTVGIQYSKLFIGFGSIQFSVDDSEQIKKFLLVLSYFKNPHSRSEAEEEFSQWDNFTYFFSKLLDHNILIESNVYDSSDRYSRQSLFFNLSGMDAKLAQQNLSEKKVAIIGCGGIGNQVAVHLATAGVQQFILCDADLIELSNLSRQILFTEEDVGALKALVLERELIKRNSNIKTSAIVRHVRNLEDLDFAKTCDFMVVSADKENIINIVNRFSILNAIPYMNVCYVNDIAVWGPLVIPNKTGCYACQDIVATDGSTVEIQKIIKQINHGYQAPSVGPINMMASGLASLDILKYLSGHQELAHSYNNRIGLWTNTLKFERQNCVRNSECAVCGDLC